MAMISKSPKPESQVVQVVLSWMAPDHLTVSEFPIHGRFIDVYGINRTTGLTVAVECKIADWRRGLHQALRCQPVAGMVYLAMPVQVAQRESVAIEVGAHGIGLLGVGPNGEVSELVVPASQRNTVPLLADRARSRFLEMRELLDA